MAKGWHSIFPWQVRVPWVGSKVQVQAQPPPDPSFSRKDADEYEAQDSSHVSLHLRRPNQTS